MTKRCLFRIEHGRACVLWVPADDQPEDGYATPEHAVWREVLIWINSDHHTLPPWTRPKG